MLPAADTGTYIVTRVNATSGTLLLLTAVLLLTCAALAMVVAWRALGHSDRLRVKLDWLRSSNEDLKAQLRSYDSATPADRKKTTLMPANVAGALTTKPKA